MKKSHWRGHVIYFEKGQWRYSDTRSLVAGEDRPCGFCNCERTPDGHDACLGTLPRVMNACCGHGEEGEAYIMFENKYYVRGADAIKMMTIIKNRRLTKGGE